MEINLTPFSNRNAINGRFLKGSIPHNKGKKWKDYVDGRKKRKMLKGLGLVAVGYFEKLLLNYQQKLIRSTQLN